MKATYKGFEAKKSGGFTDVPPVGCYVAEIQGVKLKVPGKDEGVQRETIELYVEIIEGEYKNRYHEVYDSQSERFGSAVYKGVFRLIPPTDDDTDDWRKRSFESNLWCVQQSNEGYTWDWDEKKLKGKKIGINVRKRLYTGKDKEGNPVDRETTEIGRFETVDDVMNGKCKPMRERDQREKREESTDGSEFTDVSSNVEVPWA